ncbi:hypothetical protein PHMEG_00033767 [Phytophthora megakarya]|uniref:Uncharacterized protein n=1 Tax=Phytophthora megakarya TaxID=4795 RepID=A0A225USC2_9STRA|nr:hypothetical protein PHMEG_00033767 [Phytophthora megakarya]
MVKAYVAQQVRRWEQTSSGPVIPLSTAYAWSASTPDYKAWLKAAKTPSVFLMQQAKLTSQTAMWIADLNATRLGFGTAQDLLGVQVPTALCKARQCAALLQTLLFEAGFLFDNAITEWFRTRSSKISADQVRLDSEIIQCLLSVGFIEWNKLTEGIHYESLEQWSPENSDPEDVLMTDTEASLLGESFLNQLRPRVRTARSFQGSSDEEPQSKRQ